MVWMVVVDTMSAPFMLDLPDSGGVYTVYDPLRWVVPGLEGTKSTPVLPGRWVLPGHWQYLHHI